MKKKNLHILPTIAVINTDEKSVTKEFMVFFTSQKNVCRLGYEPKYKYKVVENCRNFFENYTLFILSKEWDFQKKFIMSFTLFYTLP